MFSVQFIAVIMSAILFLLVVELVRKNALKERYSILWLASTFVLLVLSAWRGLLDEIAALVGIFYPPSFLFLAAFIFLLLIVLHFSVVISRISEKNKKLAQEMGLMKLKIDHLENRVGEDKNSNAENLERN